MLIKNEVHAAHNGDSIILGKWFGPTLSCTQDNNCTNSISSSLEARHSRPSQEIGIPQAKRQSIPNQSEKEEQPMHQGILQAQVWPSHGKKRAQASTKPVLADHQPLLPLRGTIQEHMKPNCFYKHKRTSVQNKHSNGNLATVKFDKWNWDKNMNKGRGFLKSSE